MDFDAAKLSLHLFTGHQFLSDFSKNKTWGLMLICFKIVTKYVLSMNYQIKDFGSISESLATEDGNGRKKSYDIFVLP